MTNIIKKGIMLIMNVDLLPIINNENEKVSFDGTLTYEYEGAVINAEVNGYVINFAGSLEVHGDIRADISAPCAKCLETVNDYMELSINETVGEDGIELEGTVIDIDSIVYGELMVNIPIRFVCSDECKGLCPKCGANLNIKQCQCKDDEVYDERFARPRFERRKR